MRINKFLADLGIASRRKVDELITEGRIKVNGELASFGLDVNENDKILIDDKDIYIKEAKKVYYMLNKPLEVLSSTSDNRGRKTVVDLINTKERIYPIGRLDYMTTGLIILTNDGELFNRVIHPRSEVYKKYKVKILGILKTEDINKLKNGIVLEDGKSLPAKVKIISAKNNKTELYISIREGRNRQIRRMIDSLGYRILSLSREKIGELSIENLELGQYRELTKNEVEYLYSL